MKVSEAVATRLSCRAFLDKDVPQKIIRDIVQQAQRAPSGGNLQPWHVHILRGKAVKDISQIVLQKIENGQNLEKSEYDIYPTELTEPYRSRRSRVGHQLYQLLGITRDDSKGRFKQFAENYRFFGAPVAMFFSIERIMQEGQWSDLGMFIQTIMLLAREYGLHSCAQESWAMFSPSVRAFLKIPDSHIFFCGLGLGYIQADHPANQLRTERAPFDEFASFIGFDR